MTRFMDPRFMDPRFMDPRFMDPIHAIHDPKFATEV